MEVFVLIYDTFENHLPIKQEITKNEGESNLSSSFSNRCFLLEKYTSIKRLFVGGTGIVNVNVSSFVI